MKLKLFFLTFLATFSTSLYAFSDSYIANAIHTISEKENVAKPLIYTIIDIESEFEPFAICMLTTKENAKHFMSLRNENLRVVSSEYRLNPKKWAISFYPKNITLAKTIVRAFKDQNFSFDVGLNQINTTNFTVSEIDYIFEPNYNIAKGVKVLKECQTIKGNLKDTIECYNYGTKKRKSNPYYTRFVESYNKNFGDL